MKIETYQPEVEYSQAIVRGFPEKEYHRVKRCSQSTLKLFQNTAAHAKAKMQAGFKVSREMQLGSLVHGYALTADRIEQDYYFLPEGFDLKSNDRKKLFGGLVLKHGQDYVLKADIKEEAGRIASKLTENELFAGILAGATERELSFFAEHEGIQCKGRADILFGDNVLIDLKTTSRGGSYSEVLWQVYERGYHVQAALYIDLLAILGVYIKQYSLIFVETFEPYEVSFFELSESFIAQGRATYLNYLEQYKRAVKDDFWPGYPEHFQVLEPRN